MFEPTGSDIVIGSDSENEYERFGEREGGSARLERWWQRL